MNMNAIVLAFVAALAALTGVAALPQGVVVERERDSADRAEIDRWYDFKDADPGRIARREYTKCEGTLF